MRDTMSECERVGHADGLAVGLALALAGLAPDAAPGPVAALPEAATPAGADVIRHDLAARAGISFVRVDRRQPAELTAFTARLGAVRLGVTRRLLERAVAHLSARVAGGEPIIRKQLVQGVLADAQVETEVLRRLLRVSWHLTSAVADVHDRLTVLDWELAKLLGASGYAGESRASDAFVSRLTANCWVRRVGVP
jgi:alkylation response protein AidB-like acyl-CoA dehydrogenase